MTQAKMKDGGGERCIRSAALKDVNEGLCAAAAAGGDDGNVQRVSDRTGQVAVEARAGSIAVHGGQQDFARTPLFRFARPRDGSTPAGIPASAGVGLESHFAVNALG